MSPRIRSRALGGRALGSVSTIDSRGVFDVNVTNALTMATPTETQLLDVALSSAETPATADSGFALVTLGTEVEPAMAVPAEGRTAEHTMGTASVTQTSGTWSNPSNATGLPDTAYARFTAPFGVTSPRSFGLLTGTFVQPSTPTREVQSEGAFIRLRVMVFLAPDTIGSVYLAVSFNSGSQYQEVGTIQGSTPEMTVYTLSVSHTQLTWASLPNLRWAVEADLQGSPTVASFVDVDAATVTLNTTGT